MRRGASGPIEADEMSLSSRFPEEPGCRSSSFRCAGLGRKARGFLEHCAPWDETGSRKGEEPALGIGKIDQRNGRRQRETELKDAHAGGELDERRCFQHPGGATVEVQKTSPAVSRRFPRRRVDRPERGIAFAFVDHPGQEP